MSLDPGELHRPAVADGPRTIEEAEAVATELGADMPRLGFYSYGEISPHARSGRCELHNQTMTVTSLAEVA